MKKISGTILVSDKNRGLLTALVLLLQKYFSRVITEDNSGKIMELASTGEVDVVVLDAGGSNGRTFQETLDLTRRITSLNQDVQVVALTNFGQTEAAMKLADEGAFDFVVKPWNNEKLLITLRNAWLMRDMAKTCRKAEWDYAVPAHDDKIEEKEKEKESIKADKPPSRHSFSPPTVDEVKLYCEKNGYSVNPERFVDYYESNGWMVGKNKMKNWQAAVRSWARKEKTNAGKAEPKPLWTVGTTV